MPYPTNLFGRHFLACYLLLYVVTPHKGNNMLLMTILFACGEDTKTDDTSTQDTAETSDTSDTFDTAEIEVSNVGPAGLSSSENSCAPNDGWALDIKVGLENVDEAKDIANVLKHEAKIYRCLKDITLRIENLSQGLNYLFR